MSNKEQRLRELGDYMVGTCNSLAHALEMHFPDITEDEAVEHLSAESIEECEACGWWCSEWGEREGYDFICTECADGMERDEED